MRLPSAAHSSYRAPAGADASWRRLVGLASDQLRATGWTVEVTHEERAAAWHVAARKGEKWCVVQVLPPATTAAMRQTRRRELGEAVRLTPRRGTMEQWGAHVRPGGRVVFGMETLNGTPWMGLPDEADVSGRLGVEAVSAAAG